MLKSIHSPPLKPTIVLFKYATFFIVFVFLFYRSAVEKNPTVSIQLTIKKNVIFLRPSMESDECVAVPWHPPCRLNTACAPKQIRYQPEIPLSVCLLVFHALLPLRLSGNNDWKVLCAENYPWPGKSSHN